MLPRGAVGHGRRGVEAALHGSRLARSPGPWGGRPQPDRVLRQHPAVAGGEREVPWGAAQPADRLGNRVHGVVVAGAAEVGQPAGQREPARVVRGEADPVAHRRHGDGEAGVEIEVAHLVQAGARHLQGGPHRGDAGRVGIEVRSLQQGSLDRVAVPVQIDPTVLRHTKARGALDRRDDHGGALVDQVARHEELGIGLGHHPVARRHGEQVCGREVLAQGCVRVVGRDPGEGREQLAHRGSVVRVVHPRLRQPALPGPLEQCVEAGGVDLAGVVEVHQPLEAVPAPLVLTAHGLGPARPLGRGA